jgi:hypothetical protein
MFIDFSIKQRDWQAHRTSCSLQPGKIFGEIIYRFSLFNLELFIDQRILLVITGEILQ